MPLHAPNSRVGGILIPSRRTVNTRSDLAKHVPLAHECGRQTLSRANPSDPDVRFLSHIARQGRRTPLLYVPRVVLTMVLTGMALQALAGSKLWSAEKHWAFQPLRTSRPPEDPSGWAEQAIDKFVIAKLRDKGLHPVGQADKRTLIRRVYLDLIGLPPRPDETAAYLADKSAHAYATLVDRLLTSPHYGERWGRHWLDVVRYADTAGDNTDCPVPEMYRYRDYVIDSFNNDKPYDVFLREQLAGDILAEADPQTNFAERKIATGYIALAKRFGGGAYSHRHMEIGDIIDCTGRGFMGLTLACARCHDHKTDPMSNQDYYALYGLFASTTYSFSGSESTKIRQNLVSLLYPHEEFLKRKETYDSQAGPVRKERDYWMAANPLTTRIEELQREIPALQKKIKAHAEAGKDVGELDQELKTLQRIAGETGAALEAKLIPLRAELARINDAFAPLMQTVAFAASEGSPADSALQEAGDPTQQGEVIRRGAPAFLCDATSLDVPAASSGRLEFARWLTAPNTTAGALISRVMVNRIWQHHLGHGIVGTPSNFGLNGDPPTHPELLEWLASQFLQRGWSIKTMHRLILLSKTYRLSSNSHAGNVASDPDASLLWRYRRHRLEAEVIRDSMLALSGNLDRDRSGPHPFPPETEWTFTQHRPFKEFYPSLHRSVYLMTPRNRRHPYLAIFDGPDPNLTTGRRNRSITPQQSLFLMNSPFVREQARGIAARLIQWSQNPTDRIDRACQSLFGRLATQTEVDRGLSYLRNYQEQLQHDGVPQEEQELACWTSYSRLMLASHEFSYVE